MRSRRTSPPLTREDLREVLRDELRRALADVLPTLYSRPISYRRAAELLGISRNTTLLAAIRGGHIRTVLISGRRKIPSEEIARIQRDGLPVDASRRARRARRPSRRVDPASEILALDY